MTRHVHEIHYDVESTDGYVESWTIRSSMLVWSPRVEKCSISHQHIKCEICGSKHLKKNTKRRLRTHENVVSKDKIECSFDGCNLTFSTGDFVEGDDQFQSRPRGASCMPVELALQRELAYRAKMQVQKKNSTSDLKPVVPLE
ncbi:hypothetical protein Hanom_Chr16g01420041 [Helianthus anomalus]